MLLIDDAIQVMGLGVWKLSHSLKIQDALYISSKNRNVGIGKANESTELLEVNSGITLSDSVGDTEGTVRYNSTSFVFEGRTNTAWMPLSDSPVRTLPIAETAVDYTMVAADYTILADGAAGAVNITLPDPATVTGYTYVIKAIDITNTVTLVRNGTEEIDGTAADHVYGTQWESIHIQSDGTNWFILANK